MDEIICELKSALTQAVKIDQPAALLFSGGLDSSIIAGLNPKLVAFSVNFSGNGQDINFSKKVAKFLNMPLKQINVSFEQALSEIPQVIKITQSFDPALPNDLVAYLGLKAIKDAGFKYVFSGDASDELFAGYSFMQKIDDLDGYIEKISSKMIFSSNLICNQLGLKLVQPYLDRKVVALAKKIPAELKIRKQDGAVFGKWILREAFKELLPGEFIWQSKRPLEIGSGMSCIRELISAKVDSAVADKDLDGIKFINREQRYYYAIYKQIFGRPEFCLDSKKVCPACGVDLNGRFWHCQVCGWC